MLNKICLTNHNSPRGLGVFNQVSNAVVTFKFAFEAEKAADFGTVNSVEFTFIDVLFKIS